MAAYKEGYEATRSVAEDVASRDMLKQSYEQSVETDEKTGENKPVDMFKVNNLAAQMAAQRGETRIADKFQKQAGEQRKVALDNDLNQLKLNQDKLEAFEQTINMLDSPEKAIDITAKSDLPEDQKLALISKFKNVEGSPDQFKVLKSQLQETVMTAKDRNTAAYKLEKLKQEHELKLEQLRDRRSRDQVTAAYQLGMLNLNKDKLEFQQEKFDKEFGLKEAKTEVQVDQTLERAIGKVSSDPLLKPAEKKARIAALMASAEQQKEVLRGRKSGGKGGEGGGKDAADIPQGHVDYLLKNNTPETRASFDKKYGKGAANEFIERSKQENRK
jgi:hypothetical protein